LGDEAHKIYPVIAGEQADYDRMYHELRTFRDEKPDREVICLIGDKTAGVAKDFISHYVGVDKSGKIASSLVYRNGNVLAAHNGRWILDEYGKLINSYDGSEPLVIFHGHSHSMGVLPEYKWLVGNEFIYLIEKGEEQHELEPGKVYWVNPGCQFIRAEDGRMAANFAVYIPEDRLVTLKTILYNEDDIIPSPFFARK
jgi:hypothetical protein